MKKIINGIIVAIIATAFITVPVSATAQPDSDPIAKTFKVNRNLLDEDDALVYFEYDLPYAVIPDEPASDTYIFRIFEDGSEIAWATPYVFFDRGYNEGCISFYIADGNWDSTIPTWTVRISQSPAYFAVPDSWDYNIPSSAFTSYTDKADNQLELSVNVISLASSMQTYYTGYTFLQSAPGGTVLSDPTGATYFRNVIYGLQAMASNLFLVQVLEYDYEDREWTTEQMDEYQSRFEGTWVGDDMDDIGGFFNMSPGAIMAVIIALPVGLIGIVFSSLLFRKIEPGLIFTCVIVFGFALMGWFPMALFALGLQVFAMYIGYLWFGRQSHMFISFYTFVFAMSVMICLFLEGIYFDDTERTLLNQLIPFSGINISNIASIAQASLQFPIGLLRVITWDYSFYIGNYAFLRWIFSLTLSPVIAWHLWTIFAPVVANFLRWGI